MEISEMVALMVFVISVLLLNAVFLNVGGVKDWILGFGTLLSFSNVMNLILQMNELAGQSLEIKYINKEEGFVSTGSNIKFSSDARVFYVLKYENTTLNIVASWALGSTKYKYQKLGEGRGVNHVYTFYDLSGKLIREIRFR